MIYSMTIMVNAKKYKNIEEGPYNSTMFHARNDEQAERYFTREMTSESSRGTGCTFTAKKRYLTGWAPQAWNYRLV